MNTKELIKSLKIIFASSIPACFIYVYMAISALNENFIESFSIYVIFGILSIISIFVMLHEIGRIIDMVNIYIKNEENEKNEKLENKQLEILNEVLEKQKDLLDHTIKDAKKTVEKAEKEIYVEKDFEE